MKIRCQKDQKAFEIVWIRIQRFMTFVREIQTLHLASKYLLQIQGRATKGITFMLKLFSKYYAITCKRVKFCMKIDAININP